MPDVEGAHVGRKPIVESGSPLPGTNQKPSRTGKLARGTGETDSVDPSPGPLGRPATSAERSRTRRSTAEAAGKQAGEQTCGYAVTQKPEGNFRHPRLRCEARGRLQTAAASAWAIHTGGQNLPCACSEPHHLHLGAKQLPAGLRRLLGVVGERWQSRLVAAASLRTPGV